MLSLTFTAKWILYKIPRGRGSEREFSGHISKYVGLGLLGRKCRIIHRTLGIYKSTHTYLEVNFFSFSLKSKTLTLFRVKIYLYLFVLFWRSSSVFIVVSRYFQTSFEEWKSFSFSFLKIVWETVLTCFMIL